MYRAFMMITHCIISHLTALFDVLKFRLCLLIKYRGCLKCVPVQSRQRATSRHDVNTCENVQQSDKLGGIVLHFLRIVDLVRYRCW